MKPRILPNLLLSLLLASVVALETRPAAAQVFSEDNGPASPQARRGGNSGPRLVFKDRVTARWFSNNDRFWYRNDLADGAKEFVLVDAMQGTRGPAFDHKRLAESLSKASGETVAADKLPFQAIQFTDNAQAVRFKVGETVWECRLANYDCAKLEGVALDLPVEETPGFGRRRGGDENDDESPRRGNRGASPDGEWTVAVRDHNLFLRAKDGGAEKQLTTDGKEGFAYGRAQWSPDSRTVVAFRVEPGERKEVFLVRSSPKDGGRALLEKRPYPLPGDKFSTYEPNVFDVATGKQTKPEVDRFEHEWLQPDIHWSRDGKSFSYAQDDRGHQRYRVIQIDAASGSVRNLVDEKTDTFIWTTHAENLQLSLVNWLQKTDEIVYVSEMDDWRHLYLVDATAGAMKQITKGEWVLRGIDKIDEEARQIWFTAGGYYKDQDPYFLHSFRVNFDGTGLTALTEGDGTHSVSYSPDRRFLIDTYSRVDAAPTTELRRVADGKLVCKLEEADMTALKASGWAAPEVFVAKGRDGVTDIWGVIQRPKDFDPSKKYPVIENIYAGPQGSFTPKSFSQWSRWSGLTDLGFIVVQMDGMGTANRSKAFHDVCFKNLKDAGFPDRILWHKAVAAKYPYYDISRVGIYGGSAGGQNAGGAVLFHGDFYKAAAAGCGCHDNRMDKASWNEQWMGYPVGPQYSESSNIDHAAKLRGKLLLIVGEMDDNVPTESTYRFVDALIRAGKDFDFVMVPNAGHGMGGSYGDRRMRDFFVRHLLGQEPPDRNAGPEN